MAHGFHDHSLVTLSIFIAMIASYTALDLAGRVRASAGWPSAAWLIAAAVAMGGGIWSMHFIAMLAMTFPGMEVGYDLSLTLVSLVAPILVTGIGFYVVNRPDTGRVALALSGLSMGLGIAIMHYLGMYAMQFRGTIAYDGVWVAISIAVAIGASIAALWLAGLGAALKIRLVAAVVMGLAVSGMHYSAMAGAAFQLAPEHAGHHAVGLDQTKLALFVAGTTFLILLFALVAAMFDRRFALLAEREALALRESEERFRLLLRSVSDYAIYMLAADGTVSSWNLGAERLSGYAAVEVIGRHISMFYAPEEDQAGRPKAAIAAAAAAGKHHGEGWRVRKNGSRYWASTVVEAIRTEAGDVAGFAMVVQDVTERKKSQEALHEAQYALAQSQKMEALGQLTGGVAHDFNNLLTVVMGSMELLQKFYPDDARIKRLSDNAHQAATRGAGLTQRMLAFARRQELKPVPVDVPALVRGMAEMLARTIGANVQIETHFPLRLPHAQVDPNQLELALLNLAVNARDAMPSGGMITISARETVDDVEPTGFSDPKRYVCLTVKDTGEGMDAETLAKAKEPFFTTKMVGKGTGLGLSMVHGLAEQSNGRLVMDSKPGEGTRADIWLPVAERAPIETPLTPAELGTRSSTSLVVLAVDDDHLVLENTVSILEFSGHQVIKATSGELALSKLRASERVDLVITDQAMPGMTGIQLIDYVRAERPGIGVMIVSGYAEIPAGDNKNVFKLEKPFNQQSLLDAIEKVMGVPQDDATVVPFRPRQV